MASFSRDAVFGKQREWSSETKYRQRLNLPKAVTIGLDEATHTEGPQKKTSRPVGFEHMLPKETISSAACRYVFFFCIQVTLTGCCVHTRANIRSISSVQQSRSEIIRSKLLIVHNSAKLKALITTFKGGRVVRHLHTIQLGLRFMESLYGMKRIQISLQKML